ncbi:MAG: 2-amino-4-hydroxy-6-hydroxymethyldihydropteridine diphosphokinase [Candidatus Margulisbacteria bacterium]|nr:2-amino-4-hydroxy-6-hydroxymethyldihydropteridine diphosphokinase [Candidatus Margulisiibacteriota bacterium]
MKHEAFLGLGSNLGDRYGYVNQAIIELEKDKNIRTMAVSSFLEYPAENKPEDPIFVNSVIKIATSYTPHELLKVTEEVERQLGRTDKGKYSRRTIDIDILFYDKEVVLDDDLIIPHPLMHERIFVLEPFSEIAPEAYHPILDSNIATLFRSLKEGREI